jgi:DNA mismatch repair protein MutS2
VRAAGLSTGETGSVRANARAALDAVVERLKAPEAGEASGAAGASPASPAPLTPGTRVTVGALGLEGVVLEVHGKHAEVDVRGKRLRASLHDLKVVAGSANAVAGSASRDPAHGGRRPRGAGSAGGGAAVHVNVDLQPREGSLTELNVIGNTVDEALRRLEKFLDDSTVTDIRELRIVHGHGTGQLRRAIAEYLKGHPLVARFEAAPQNQGGGGATIVELRD